jgi:hypothetical protein
MSIYILVQEAMDFAMTFYYRLTVTEVFAFVEYIMTKANFGWLIQLISSSVVGKYDGLNGDLARISHVHNAY